MNKKKIAFQGQNGAYSHLACTIIAPEMNPYPCKTFEDAFYAVESSSAELALIPIENSQAGRVADIHSLLPSSSLHIIGEYFQRVRHNLLALKGSSLDQIKSVESHQQAISQCRNFIQENNFISKVSSDTAGAAADVANAGDFSRGAIASTLAAEIYSLDIIKSDIEDATDNTTRFLLMSAQPKDINFDNGKIITSIVFKIRNLPAALFKALGGFATNRVNLLKLESYMLEGSFSATQFYADIEGHPDQVDVRLALEELGFFSKEVKVLGVYPASDYRKKT